MPEIRYHILRMDKLGTPPVEGLVFVNPAEAARKAKELSREMGEKLRVKPIIDPQWRRREQIRFRDGIYRHLPWADSDWWIGAVAIHRNHYAHPSIERPGFIAYTKSDEDGSIDKQTIVKVGAYLKQFKQVLYNYGIEERDIIDDFMEMYGPIEVKFAKTEEEIISVYENGPQTCMMGKDWPKDGRNPAYIYAAGDLEVAYIGTLHRARARTLVWPAKKIYSRVYGDIARLTQGLHRLGYKWGAPIGARVQKVQLREVKFNPRFGHVPQGCFLTPYIDKKNQQGGGHLSIIDNGDHMLICEEGRPGSHHCGLPDGESGMYVPREDEFPTFTCQRCGTQGHRRLVTICTHPDPDEGEEKSWCDKCIKRNAFMCEYSRAWYPTETVDRVIVDNQSWWCRYFADMHATKCEKTGEFYSKNKIIKLHYGGKVIKVGPAWIHQNGGAFQSGLTGRFFLIREMVVVNSLVWGCERGCYCSSEELRHHAFCCTECHRYWRIAERIEVDDALICPSCAHNKDIKNKEERMDNSRAQDAAIQNALKQ